MSKIYDKTAANLKATTIDSKIVDAQRILVRPKGGSINDRVDIFDVVETSLIGDIIGFDSNQTTYTGETEGVSIQLDKEDFIPSGVYLKEISLPYKNAINGEARYCHVLVFNDRDEQILKITSSNTQRRQTGSGNLLVSTWDYNNILMPTYSYVRIALSTSATLPITGNNGTNCSNFRINVCRNTSNQNIAPTNLSKLYSSNGSTQAYLGWVRASYGEHILSEVGDIKIKMNELENSIDTLGNYGTDYYTEYDTTVFQSGIESVGNVYTSSVRFGSTHMPKGRIQKVSFYGRDASSSSYDSKTNGCYLLAKIYKKDSGELVRSHASTNKVVVREKQSGESVRPLNTWVFDGFDSIEEDEVIKFIPSSDGVNQTANYYFGCAVDTTHTHDNCQVGGDGNFATNPLANGEKYLALAVFEGKFFYDITNKCINEYEKTFLRSLFTTTTAKAFDNNINNETLGVGNVRAFVLERPYITNGIFNEVRWESQGTVSSTCYLKITLRDKRGKAVKTLMSDDDQDFSVQGEKIYRFTEDFEVTDDIGSILFEPSSATTTSPQFRVRVIGNASKPNAGGSEVTNNNFIIHVVFYGKVAQPNDNILSKERADSLYAPKSGVTTGSYDWTPDLQNNIKLEVSSYTMPVNGWLVSRDWQYLAGHDEIRINDLPVGQVNPDGNFSLLVKKDDVLTVGDGNGTATFWFLPCKSEQYDYRVTHTPYDIWRGAVTTDAQGNTVVQDMHCPDASGWYSAVGNALQITKVEDEVAYNGDTFVCNIQSSEIVNGNDLMGGFNSLTTWDSDLQRLEIGTYMFYYTDISEFASDLSSLTNGRQMFRNCFELTTFTSDLKSLTNGYGMFQYCDKLTTFTSDLSSLTNGYSMFYGCSNLTTFTSDSSGSPMNLSSLTDGTMMFSSCDKLESFSSDLNSLTDGFRMFDGCYKLTTFTSDLSSLTEGYEMFAGTSLKQFNSNLSSLETAIGMFAYCDNLSEFSSDLSSLTNGNGMFWGCGFTSFTSDLSSLEQGDGMFHDCNNLTTFTPNLSSLINGDRMFQYCRNITTFSNDLSSVTDGYCMFYSCDNLTTFSSNLKSLTNGSCMFLYSEKLESFTSDLSSLTDGSNMFDTCRNLTTFSADLSSLSNGEYMFERCKLNGDSVERILTTIPTHTSDIHKLSLTMDLSGCQKAVEILGITNATIPHHEVYSNRLEISYKGWTLYLSTTQTEGYTVIDPTAKFDISAANGYIPNASGWRENVYLPNNLTIVQVRNGIAYDDDAVDPEL